MQCAGCAMLIEGELADIGVEATCHCAQGNVDITWDEKKVSEKDIQKILTKLGYSIKG